MKKVYAIAGIIALICLMGAYYVVKTQNDANRAAKEEAAAIMQEKRETTTTIVTTTRQVLKGEVFTSDMVKTIDVDRAVLISIDALTDPNMAIGRKAARTISEGETITENCLYSLTRDNAVLSYNIPEGMVAIQIPVNVNNSVAGFIEEGDFVDILTAIKQETGETAVTNSSDSQQSRVEWVTLAQNLEVLRTGDRLYNSDLRSSEKSNYEFVVVAVDKAMAIKISNEISNNEVKLILNSKSEEY